MSLPPLHYSLVRAKKEQRVVRQQSSCFPLPKSCWEFNPQPIPVHTDANKQHFTPGVALFATSLHHANAMITLDYFN